MARKVNKRFLIILTCVVMGGTLAAMVLVLVLRGGSPDQYIAQGDRLVANARQAEPASAAELLRQAKEAYVKALRRDGSRTDIMLKLADALEQRSRYDLEEVNQDIRLWERILELEPKHREALSKLLDAYIDLIEIAPSQDSYSRVREKAIGLVRADPENLRAKAYEHIGLIGAWNEGKAVPEDQIRAAVAALSELLKQKPDEPGIPYFMYRATLRLAQSRGENLTGATIKEQREKALAGFEEALKLRPNNPGVAYRYAAVRLNLLGAERDEQARAKELDAIRRMLEQAAADLKPDNRDLAEVRMTIADVAARQGKIQDAEKVLTDLLRDRPYDMRARLLLARFYRQQRTPEKAAKAIELLAQPQGDDPTLIGLRARLRRDYEYKRVLDLTQLRLDVYGTTPQKDRPALRQAIDEGYAQVASYVASDEPDLLKLRGQILCLDDDRKSLILAVQALQKALDKLEQKNRTDYELAFLLARLYRDRSIHQTGQARLLLEKLVERFPTAKPARMELARLLLEEQYFEKATPHVLALAKEYAQDPNVLRLRVMLSLGSGKADEAGQIVDALPTETDEQRMVKAQALVALGRAEAALAMLEPMAKAELSEPKSAFAASRLVAFLHLNAKRKTEALTVIEQVLKVVPNDRTWRIFDLIARDRATPEEIEQVTAEVGNEAMERPGSVALRKYDELLRQRKAEEALAVLQDAEKQTNGAGMVLQALFNHALRFTREGTPGMDLALADLYVQKLEKADWDRVGGRTYRTLLNLARHDGEAALRTALELTRMQDFAENWVLLGKAQQLTGQMEPAIASFNKALEKQLDNTDALIGLVQSHLVLGQVPLARRYVAEGIRSTSGPIRASFQELEKQIEEEVGDPAKVMATREQDVKEEDSLRTRGALCANYLRVASKLRSKNQADEAQKYLDKALAVMGEAVAKWPDELEAYALLARVQHRAGKSAEAEKVLQQLAGREKWKEKPEPLLLLANFYRLLGPEWLLKADQAFAGALEKARQMDVSQNTKTSLLVRRQQAAFYLGTSQLEKAIGVLSELLKETKDPELRRQLIEVQVDAGKHQEAEAALRSALAEQPDDPRLLSLLAFVKLKRGDVKGASEQIELALKADAQFATARYYRGLIRLNTGDRAGALADLQAAADASPGHVEVRVALADALRQNRQSEEAAQQLEVALRRAPSRGDIRSKLVEFYFAEKRWAPAERLLQEATAHPELAQDPKWWKLTAQMWLNRQNLQAAADAVREARKLAPEDPESLYLGLGILQVTGQADKVLAEIEPMLARAPGSAPWWLLAARARALKSKGNTKEAEDAFDRAMTAAEGQQTITMPADKNKEEVLVQTMITAMGVPWTANRLSARRDARWGILHVQIYMASQDWKNTAAAADALLAGELQAAGVPVRLQALETAGMAYAVAASVVPGAAEKAERAYIQYLAELERHQGEVSLQLGALNNLASLFAEHPTNPDPAKALNYSKRAHEIMLKAGIYHHGLVDTHAWVLILSGRVDEGMTLLADQVSRGGALPEAFYHLGEAHLRKGRLDEAQTNFSLALATITENRDKGRPVDPALEPKVQESIKKLKQAREAAPGRKP